MEEYLKIKNYLFNIDFSSINGVDNLLDILQDKRVLEDLKKSYGDELSVICSPEFIHLKEKYVDICC